MPREKISQEAAIREISSKIGKAKKIADLVALNDRVNELFGDDVPLEIQELADNKGKELNVISGIPGNQIQEDKSVLQKDWKKVTPEEARELEKERRLAGYDPDEGLALII